MPCLVIHAKVLILLPDIKSHLRVERLKYMVCIYFWAEQSISEWR